MPRDPSLHRATLVYDGTCRFCRSQIDFIRRSDRENSFTFVPAQSPDLLSRFPVLKREELASGLRLIDAGGTVFRGADAVHEIARRLTGWRRLAWLYRVPGLRQIFRAVYRWIAARRYRLAGPCDQTCASEPNDSAHLSPPPSAADAPPRR